MVLLQWISDSETHRTSPVKATNMVRHIQCDANCYEVKLDVLSRVHITDILLLLLLPLPLFYGPWTVFGTTRMSQHYKGKTRKVKPIWIYWSKR